MGRKNTTEPKRLPGSKKRDLLYSEIPHHRRAAFAAKYMAMVEQGADELLADPEASGRNKIEGGLSAMKAMHELHQMELTARKEDEIGMKCSAFLASLKEQDQSATPVTIIINEAPSGSPGRDKP